MKAIILACRRATRLLPLTKDKAQCILKVGTKTILELQIDSLRKAGITEIIVVTGHLAEQAEQICQQMKVRTLFNPFYDVSWMALALWLAKEELKEGFIFLYSDILFDHSIVKNLLLDKNSICLAIKKDGIREEAEKVVEKEKIIKNISKNRHPLENGEFIGLAKFSPRGAEALMQGLSFMAKKDLSASLIQTIDYLIKRGELVNAYEIKDKIFIDIDFPEDLDKAKHIFS